MFHTFRAFLSGLFAGMAHDQAKRGDYAGTKWRADMAIRWASNPYSYAVAHAAGIQAALVGKNVFDAREHLAKALGYIDHSQEFSTLPDMAQLRCELLELRSKLL